MILAAEGTFTDGGLLAALAWLIPVVPLVADIHFDYRWAMASLKAGIHGLRLNPGNIRDPEKIKTVGDAIKHIQAYLESRN